MKKIENYVDVLRQNDSAFGLLARLRIDFDENHFGSKVPRKESRQLS
jgi:hypothetical protein